MKDYIGVSCRAVLLAAAILVGLSGQVVAVTYYVSPTGSNTAPYDTWAKAANAPSSVVTAGNSSAGPHLVYIAPGSYDDSITLTDGDWANSVWYGVSAVGLTAPAMKGDVVVSSSTSAAALNVARGGITLANIGATSTHSSSIGLYFDGSYTSIGSFFGNNLWIHNTGSRLIYAYPTSVTGIFTRAIVEGCEAASSAVQFNHTGGTVVFNYSIFRASDSKPFGVSAYDSIVLGNTGNLTLNNSFVSGHIRSAVTASKGVLTLNNSMILPSVKGGIATVTQSSTGVVHLYNDIILKDWNTTGTHTAIGGTITTDEDNIYAVEKKLFKRQQKKSYLIPSVDDSGSVDYTKMLEALLRERGQRGQWAVSAYPTTSNAETLAEAQGMLDRGVVRLAHHGYSHADLTQIGNVMTITKAGATISVDRAADAITVNPGGAVSEYKTKLLSTIKTELEALGCTVSIRVGLTDYSLGEIMQTGSGASPYSPQLLIDATGATGWYNVELVQAKALLEGAISGLTLRSIFTPGATNSIDLRTAVKAAGLWGSRSIITNTGNGFMLQNINAYGISHINSWQYLSGSTDAETKQNCYALLEAMSSGGLILSVLAHTTEEFSENEWRILLDAARDFPTVIVTDMDTALTDIRANWTTSDDITYTNTLPDNADYRLHGSSPARDAGKDVGLTTDFLGKSIKGLPDIGAYEYRGGWPLQFYTR